MIDDAWRNASSRPGINLFDGSLCRLERSQEVDDLLELVVSPTSYKAFVGTNLWHPELAQTLGPDALANPLGASAVLLTSDGHAMLGRRNASVAYYPHRIHPFAGSLEPQAPLDVFAEVRRELAEELDLGESHISRIVCTGMIEDCAIRQPELTFFVETVLPLDQARRLLKDDEHLSIWSVPAEAHEVIEALHSSAPFTPVALGTLLLWGRVAFGDSWYEQARTGLT